jgi:membrane-associated phospholipid phosphatase
VALTPTDIAIGLYQLFFAVLIVALAPLTPARVWLLVACALTLVLLALFHRMPATARVGRVIHVFYPLIIFGGLYTALGILNGGLDPARIPANDALVQRWEVALFGGQPSYDLIRRWPSVFWSGLLHVAYVSYYPTIVLPAPILALRGDLEGARRVISGTIIGYLLCYVVFALFPVAGPNWAFPHPTGPVRDVWSARLVYSLLEGGSSVGTAFPSSHVAATLATVIGAWRVWPAMGKVTLVPLIGLTVAVVYCQMHYAMDALVGLGFGAVAGFGATGAWGRVAVTAARYDQA